MPLQIFMGLRFYRWKLHCLQPVATPFGSVLAPSVHDEALYSYSAGAPRGASDDLNFRWGWGGRCR